MGSKLTIIAGPCSIDKSNISDIYSIAKIATKDNRGHIRGAVTGVRVVGLKSRTRFSSNDSEFLGIDKSIYLKNLETTYLRDHNNLIEPPSVALARKIIADTNMLIATEIVSPLMQMQFYKHFPKNKLLFWNPSVNQLGWPMMEIAKYCKGQGWYIGIKNPRWLGSNIKEAESEKRNTSMEQAWQGLSTYCKINKSKIILIHRGVDVPEKRRHRFLPVHGVARRIKSNTGFRLFFDPSHTFGSKLRKNIVDLTVDAMRIKHNKTRYLYDGILIEVGKSKTDTRQHISVDELQALVDRLSEFRQLTPPGGMSKYK